MRGIKPRFAALVGAATVAVLLTGCGSGGEVPPAAPKAAADPLPTLDPGAVDLGRGVYVQNCAACHRANAQGAPNWTKTDVRGNLPPPPHDDSGHTWRHGDAELAEIIRNGQRDIFNKTPELTMPPFKDRLSDAEISAVIAYFKSLWSPEHRRYQAEQSQRPAMPMGTPEGER